MQKNPPNFFSTLQKKKNPLFDILIPRKDTWGLYNLPPTRSAHNRVEEKPEGCHQGNLLAQGEREQAPT